MHKQNLVHCMYQKGLSKFTDFISIRIKFYISYYYVPVHVSGL